MRIGLLSDAHGNLPGLKACLDYLSDQVSEIFFLGDAVGYFPDSVLTVELLNSVNVHFLMGNHDAMLLGHLALDPGKEEIYHIEKARKKMPGDYTEQLAGCLPYAQREVDGKRILLVHGSPWDPLNGYVYPDDDLKEFSRLPFDIVFMGHTHRPFIKRSDDVTLVNVGSCGLPRDHGCLACCAIYDTGENSCDIIRIEYDVKTVLQRYENDIHPSVMQCLLRKDEIHLLQDG